MKYISLAFHNSEMIVVDGMDVFTAYFCYSKKQRQGPVSIPVPAAIAADEDEASIVSPVPEEIDIVDEDVL